MNKLEVNTIKPDVQFHFNEEEYRILDLAIEDQLDKDILNIENYIEVTSGLGKTDLERDSDYDYVQNMWKTYQHNLREAKFNFYLDRSQYNLLTDLLLKKLEYDVNTLFIALELSELLGSMSGSKYNTDLELKTFGVTPTEITYIYHLIQNYKVKGLTKESITFSKILIRIGDISKIVSYYDASVKRLTEEIQTWAISLEESDPIDSTSLSQ